MRGNEGAARVYIEGGLTSVHPSGHLYFHPLHIVPAMMHRGRSLLLAVAALAALAGPARSQTRLFAGVVKDSVGAPIFAAAVSIGADVVRTDSAGTFVIALPRADSVAVTIRRLGFEQVAFTLSTDEAAANTIEIVMNSLAAKLSAVEVEEMEVRSMTILRNFDERVRSGLGVYITRDAIEKRNTSQVTDLLRGQRGVTVDKGVVRFARQQGRACAPDVYVDGQYAPGLPLEALHPEDVEGIEVYSGISQIPAEFVRNGRFNCGAIVFWSRRPIVVQSKQKAPATP